MAGNASPSGWGRCQGTSRQVCSPSRNPVSPGDPHDRDMGPARGLPVRTAAWRRMAGSFKRCGDLAIGGTFRAHLPNAVDNTCIETGNTPCDRRLGLFTVLRAPGPSFCHVIPPTMRRFPGGYRGTTVQTEQDGRVIDRGGQMTHHCQSPQRPFSSLLRANSLRKTETSSAWRSADLAAPGEHTFAESASFNSRAGPQRANSEQLQCGATARRLPERWRENANARSFGPLFRSLTDLANKTGMQIRQRACGPPGQGKSFSHSHDIRHSAARFVVIHTDTRRLPQPKRTRAHPTIWLVCSGN